jgi:hypothetical protein
VLPIQGPGRSLMDAGLLPRNKYRSLSSYLAQASCTLVGTNPKKRGRSAADLWDGFSLFRLEVGKKLHQREVVPPPRA